MSDTTTALAAAAASGQQQQQQADATQAQTTNSGDFFSLSFKDLAPEKLPEPLRDWGTLKKYPTATDALLGFRELEKAYSSRQQLKPPGEGAKPEEVEAWRSLLGVPKTPEEYGLKKPENLPEGVEWNEDMAKGFAALAHKHHLPPSAVQEIIDFHNANIGKMGETARSQQEAQVATAQAELQKMWGADVGKNAQMAAKAAEMAGIEKPLQDPDFANSPKMAKAFYNFAEMLNKLTQDPSRLITGDTNPMGGSAEALMNQIRNSDDFNGKNGPEKAQAAVKRLEAIYSASQKK